jgi:FMN-dependent NADH-azoreductase
LIGRFQRANRIVLGLPMWNFSIPYKLKQLIDLTAQRNYLFTYDGKEYGPSLNIPKAPVVYTGDLRIARVLQYHQASITRLLTLIFGFA